MNWKIAFAVLAGICAIAALAGANLFDIDPVKILAVGLLSVAVAVVIPPN